MLFIAGVKSKVEKKEFLLDEVEEEETELEFVLCRLLVPLTGSGEVAKDKRRVEPSGELGKKVIEGRSAMVDDLKEVKERARLAVLHGEEDTNKMVACLVKEIWLGIEEEKSELKKANIKLEKELVRSRTDALKKVRQLKASHTMEISQLQVETKANLGEMVEKHDKLRHHLMLKGYSKEKVDVIKADTYAEEEDEEEAEAVGIVDGLNGVSRQTALREMKLRIKDLESGLARERKTSKALLFAQVVELDSSRSREDGVLMCNREFAEQFNKMKEANENREDQYAIARAKRAEARERSGGSRTEVKTPLVRGDIKLDTALIREIVLEGEIKANESLVKRNEELSKDILAREELNTEIRRLRARVVDLEAMYLAE
ncbi:hypothetical protein GIB67_010931 [Kingdonia uniflora]|uniref:Uncharacterized protein n=1 Tax=Kingdonia uniflora TaxID=39325 RepID=A0A7J7M4Q5_9MAGN|nr:hypothetical protein GIB67_010931 [Kingdonia uniflora]